MGNALATNDAASVNKSTSQKRFGAFRPTRDALLPLQPLKKQTAMKEYKYTINGNKYEVAIAGIEDNIANVVVNGEEYKVEMEKEPEPVKKKVVGMLEAHSCYSKYTDFESLQEQIISEGKKRVNDLDGSITVLDRAKKMLEKNPQTTINEIYEYIKKEVAARGIESIFEDFKLPERMIARLGKIVQSNASALKQMSSLVVSLAMLPVTCSLLNWTYPRFMDMVFPNLSNKKHDTESSNLIKRATKKAEVSA